MSADVQSPVFVGRRDEMASLASLLHRVQQGEPAFALIAGEAGVGKTRLASELAARAADAGFTVRPGEALAGCCPHLTRRDRRDRRPPATALRPLTGSRRRSCWS